MSAPPATRPALPVRRRIAAGRWQRSWRAPWARWLAVARAHPTRLAGGLIALGLALRLTLAAVGWPATDSDEGTMGLMARHIAYQGAHPIFFYGQHYMGALEAYLAAGFFRLFGPSLFTLRLSDILLSTLFLLAFYPLARRLCGPGLALAALALLALGSPEALLRQIFTGGGYAETLLFGTLCLLLAICLASPQWGRTPEHLSPNRSPTRGEEPRIPPLHRGGEGQGWGERLALYAAWGVCAGLGIWSDVLVLPFVLTSLAVLLLFRWRELRGVAALALALGLLVGLAPLLIYAAGVPGHNPFGGAVAVQQSDSAYQGNLPALFAGELLGTVAVSVPIISGGAALPPLAPAQAWPLSAGMGAYPLLATGLHALWGMGFLALLVLALARSARALWPARGRLLIAWKTQESRERSTLAVECARLAVLVGAAATVLLFAASPVAARAPAIISRYLIGVLIALPLLIEPLWRANLSPRPSPPQGEREPDSSAHQPLPTARAPLPPWGRGWERGARLALGTLVLAWALGLVGIISSIPQARAHAAQQAALIADLERLGATRIYSDYWTCDRVAFLSGERIICAALDHQLQPDLDRYPPYRVLLAATPHPAYVFATGSAQAATFAARAAATPGAYTLARRDGYDIYRPVLAPRP